jgi:hypothetical protein
VLPAEPEWPKRPLPKPATTSRVVAPGVVAARSRASRVVPRAAPVLADAAQEPAPDSVPAAVESGVAEMAPAEEAPAQEKAGESHADGTNQPGSQAEGQRKYWG